MKKLLLALVLLAFNPAFGWAQSYGSPTYNNVTVNTLNGAPVPGAPQNFWISSHFSGSNTNLYISTSSDGITWKNLLNSTALYIAPGGTIVHDPVMTYLNGTFYVAYLNQTITPTSTFGLASSTDLIHWSLVQNVPVPITGATANEVVWSPFWFTDSDNSLHVILGASPDCKVSGGGLCSGNAEGMNLYEMHPVTAGNLAGSWSAPVLITGTNIPTSTGTQSGIFNPALIKIGSTYNLFYNNGQNNYYNEWASSTSLTSGYSTVETGNWAGWQPNVNQPPQGLNLIHVAPNHWRAYFDAEATGVESYSDCLSENWTACTWTSVTALTFADATNENQGTYALFSGAVPPTPIVQANSTYGLQQTPSGPVVLQNKIFFGTTFDGATGWAGTRSAFFMNDGTTEALWQLAAGAAYFGTENNTNLNLVANNVTELSIAGATGTVTVSRSLVEQSLISGGVATFTASGCGVTSLAGGGTTGKMLSGTTGTCTVIITPGATAPNGWYISAVDLTTPADLLHETAYSTTTVTFTGTTVSGDLIVFNAAGF